MQDDDTLFGKAEPPKSEPKAADAAADEQEEALSRAARNAVHQPADPRIEKSFGHLAVAAEEGSAPGGAAGTLEIDALRIELAEWRASLADLTRRLAIATWMMLGLTVLIGLLAIVLIVRGF